MACSGFPKKYSLMRSQVHSEEPAVVPAAQDFGEVDLTAADEAQDVEEVPHHEPEANIVCHFLKQQAI